MLHFEIASSELDRLALNLAATDDQARKALRSTLNKMAGWLRVQSIKGLSKSLQIQQKIIRRRLKAVKFKQTAAGGVAKVWYGLNPVDLIYLGRSVPGGFLGTGKGGKKQVFKRRGSARLPIDKQSQKILKPAEQALDGGMLSSAAFEAQFWKTFEHELKWQTR